MDSIENNLSLLLEGLALQDSEELCDFSLADQNEAIGRLLISYIRHSYNMWIYYVGP